MKKKFVPCPHCGKTKPVRIGAASEDEGFDGSTADTYAVVCGASKWEGHNPGGCGAQGGYRETEEQAIAAWNLRLGLQIAEEDQLRKLSLLPIDTTDTVAFDKTRQAVVALNPMLGKDSKALHFAAQGWLAAQHATVAA